MEEFRKKINRNLKISSFLCCMYPSMFIAAKAIFRNTGDFSQGLVLGFFSGIMIVSVYFLARNYAALHDEEKLKQLYIELNDERNIAIGKETLKTASTICMAVTGAACLISGFINEIVSITLGAALLACSIITIAVQMYYKKNM